VTMPEIIQGTLQSDGRLRLDQAPNLPPGPVVVTVQSTPTATSTTRGLADLIDEIHKGQQARAFQGRSDEEIEAVRQEREVKYENRMHTANHTM
jgi:hypothetical protein